MATLVPGILSYESTNGEEFLAVDEGVLVKLASDVVVSTRNAIQSKDLGMLKEIVEKEFLTTNERERKTRSILARLEADFAKKFLKMTERS